MSRLPAFLLAKLEEFCDLFLTIPDPHRAVRDKPRLTGEGGEGGPAASGTSKKRRSSKKRADAGKKKRAPKKSAAGKKKKHQPPKVNNLTFSPPTQCISMSSIIF